MITASELVLRARANGQLEVLDRAEQLARDATDWCAIAASYRREQRDRAAYCLSRALAEAGNDLRVYRSVAFIQRACMNDAAAASRALAAAGAMLLASDASTLQWCSLAEAWRQADDRDAELDYLRHARAAARSVEDFCAIGDLDRADSIARTTMDHIAIARACDDAQDLDRVNAHLDAGRAAIASVDDARAMVEASETFGEGEGRYEVPFRNGAKYATTARDWIALSAIALASDDRQACYLKARQLGDDMDRVRIEALERRDGARDGAVEPLVPLLTPEQLLHWSTRSIGWPHEPATLFERVRAELPAETRRRIAGNDYGMDFEDNLAAVEEVVATGRIRHPLPWSPHEVLALERWSEGEDIDHLARAFACAVLVLDDAGPSPVHEGSEQSIGILLHSCLVLGTEAIDAAIGLFAAIANAHRDELIRMFAELALILAATWRDPSDPRLPGAIARLVLDEDKLRGGMRNWPGEGWLLGLTYFDQRHALWRELGNAILAVSPHAKLRGLLGG